MSRRLRVEHPLGARAVSILGSGLSASDGPLPQSAFPQPCPSRSLAWNLLLSPAEIGMSAIPLEAAKAAARGGAHAADDALGGASKLILDKLVALAALVVASPLMLLVALFVRLSDGGPAIYGHERVGANGRSFRCYKFRTMVQNGDEVLRAHLAADPESAREWAATRKLRSDPRITPLGRLLRRSSIDELPQLLNVLRGEMSCVGPRPVTAAEIASYGPYAEDYLATRPGMTGLWQICGRSRIGYADRVKLDALYVRRWSLPLDLVILLKTIPAVMRTSDAA